MESEEIKNQESISIMENKESSTVFDLGSDPSFIGFKTSLQNELMGSRRILQTFSGSINKNSGFLLILQRIANDSLAKEVKTTNTLRFSKHGKLINDKCIDSKWYQNQLDVSTGFCQFVFSLRQLLGEDYKSLDDGLKGFVPEVNMDAFKEIKPVICIEQVSDKGSQSWTLDFSGDKPLIEQGKKDGVSDTISFFADDLDQLENDIYMSMSLYCNARIRSFGDAENIKPIFASMLNSVQERLQAKQATAK